MTFEELIERLEQAEQTERGGRLRDEEDIHAEQDAALLDYINNDRVREIYERTRKWYA